MRLVCRCVVVPVNGIVRVPGDALDLVVPAHITFGTDDLGEFEMIAIGASVDYRITCRNDEPAVEFSWTGFDEGDAVSGRGWAHIEGEALVGEFFIHQGDETTFVARRED